MKYGFRVLNCNNLFLKSMESKQTKSLILTAGCGLTQKDKAPSNYKQSCIITSSPNTLCVKSKILTNKSSLRLINFIFLALKLLYLNFI